MTRKQLLRELQLIENQLSDSLRRLCRVRKALTYGQPSKIRGRKIAGIPFNYRRKRRANNKQLADKL
jgi:hypothetical protein